MRTGESVSRMIDFGLDDVLHVGSVVSVTTRDRPLGGPPPWSTEDVEALKAGTTLVRPRPSGPVPAYEPPALDVKVVEYERQGFDHVYTFEAV